MDTRPTRLARALLSLSALLGACSQGPSSNDVDNTDATLADTAPPLDAAPPTDAAAPTDARPRTDVVQCPAPLGTAVPRGAVGALGYPMDSVLRMNHVQVKGTHNSYHIRPPDFGPDWDYTHQPLDVQLDQQGVRQLELDVHWNATCNRYEVYHLALIDPLSTCNLFTECLQTMRTWSDAHPGHMPMYLHIEPKDQLDSTLVEARMTALEAEVLSVFPRELIITPDEVQGSAATLNDAVLHLGWPTLGATRGRMLVYLDNTDVIRDVYTRTQTSLHGRLFFTDSTPGTAIAGVSLLNHPVGDPDAANLRAAVMAGYLVRTFAEESDQAAHANDGSWLAAGLMLGAQILSSDFPAPIAGQTYFADIPMGTPGRCNPLTAPPGCTSDAIESPARLTPH